MLCLLSYLMIVIFIIVGISGSALSVEQLMSAQKMSLIGLLKGAIGVER